MYLIKTLTMREKGCFTRVVKRQHFNNPGHFTSVDIQITRLGIKSAAAPFAAAVKPGENDAALPAGRHKEGAFPKFIPANFSVRRCFGRPLSEVFFPQAVAGKRRWFSGNRLCRPSVFS